MANNKKILLKVEEKPRLDEFTNFINELTANEQERLLTFIQGFRFAKSLIIKETDSRTA